MNLIAATLERDGAPVIRIGRQAVPLRRRAGRRLSAEPGEPSPSASGRSTCSSRRRTTRQAFVGSVIASSSWGTRSTCTSRSRAARLQSPSCPAEQYDRCRRSRRPGRASSPIESRLHIFDAETGGATCRFETLEHAQPRRRIHETSTTTAALPASPIAAHGRFDRQRRRTAHVLVGRRQPPRRHPGGAADLRRQVRPHHPARVHRLRRLSRRSSTTQMAGGTEADIMQVNWPWLPLFSARMATGSPTSTSSPTPSTSRQWSEADLAAGTDRTASCNGLSVSTTGRVLFFNKTQFDKAGLPIPKTWDELIAAAPVFKEKLGKPTTIRSRRRPERALHRHAGRRRRRPART